MCWGSEGEGRGVRDEGLGNEEPHARSCGRVKGRTVNRAILIVSVLLGSWLGMQVVHEFGHVVGAWLTGGRVIRVVLYPFTISRTDVDPNPRPLFVVWAGPLFGALAPLALWAVAGGLRRSGAFLLRFFAGFCLIANGAYIAGGSFGRVGDCGVMLRNGSAIWQLWLFGAVTVPVGLWLWNRQARNFGLGSAGRPVTATVAYSSLATCMAMLVFAFFFGRG